MADREPPPAPAPAPGVRCPGCGARAHAVRYVRQRPGYTRRFRQCRACGRRFRTVERPE